MASAVAVALTGSDQSVSSTHCTYYGFSIRETVGAAAVIRIYNNASANSGTLLDTISLAANESAREDYAMGLQAENGIYIDIVSGTVEGSVRLG